MLVTWPLVNYDYQSVMTPLKPSPLLPPPSPTPPPPGLNTASLSAAKLNYFGITDDVSRSIALIATTILLIPPAVGSAENRGVFKSMRTHIGSDRLGFC